MALDRYDEALTAYQKSQIAAPQDLRLHLAKGNVYFWNGDTERAAAEYTAWAKQAPADPAPHTLLGLVFAGQDKPADALAQYTQAAQLSDCDPAVLLLLGGAQAAAGDLNAAQRTYAQATSIDPQNPDVLFSAGANNLMLDDNQAAAENFAALVARRPDMLKAHYYLGVAYDALGEHEKAQAAYAEAARLGEQTSPPPLDLAFAYAGAWPYRRCHRDLRAALAEHESPDLHAYLGCSLCRQGRQPTWRARSTSVRSNWTRSRHWPIFRWRTWPLPKVTGRKQPPTMKRA